MSCCITKPLGPPSDSAIVDIAGPPADGMRTIADIPFATSLVLASLVIAPLSDVDGCIAGLGGLMPSTGSDSAVGTRSKKSDPAAAPCTTRQSAAAQHRLQTEWHLASI